MLMKDFPNINIPLKTKDNIINCIRPILVNSKVNSLLLPFVMIML